MYDIMPLYNAGITGSGQKVVVVGQTDVNLADIEAFRTYFNLSPNDPQTLLIPGVGDPGVSARTTCRKPIWISNGPAQSRLTPLLFMSMGSL